MYHMIGIIFIKEIIESQEKNSQIYIYDDGFSHTFLSLC